METRQDQRVYKFNITQHHNPYISCFVIVNHLSQLPHLNTSQDSVYQLGDSAFEHILVHAFTLLQSNLCRDRDVVLC